jgi:hypothetical protein
MHADWVKLMSTYSSTDGVLIASADCSTQSQQPGTGADLCNHYNLPYYPYIVYGSPSNPSEYSGNRDYNSLLSFARNHLGSEADAVSFEVNGGTLDLTWEDCGDASTHGKISGIDTDKIVLGQDTTVTGTGTSDEDISGGDFKITAKAGPITQNYEGKVCEAKEFDLPLGLGKVQWKGLSCPAAAGTISVGVGVKLAAVIPASVAKADISVTATGSSADDKLLCMNLHAVAEKKEVCPKPTVV